MIPTEFGIIEDINETDNYDYNPKKYGCVAIDDDLYINDWWHRLLLMKTYFNNLNHREFGLARWGITIIPPESLPMLQEIVLSDRRIAKDDRLAALAAKIQDAALRGKYMIHYGV